MKIVKIMRGIPGSGKSTHAKLIRQVAYDMGLTPIIVSADDFFMDGSTYKFDAAKLGEAHKWCLKSFLLFLDSGNTPIIVDNTNINLEDIAPYVAVAEALDFDVEIVQVNTHPELAASRNVHSVPKNRVLDMHRRLTNIVLPKRWKVTVITP